MHYITGEAMEEQHLDLLRLLPLLAQILCLIKGSGTTNRRGGASRLLQQAGFLDDRVGIDQDGASLDEAGGDGALAGADSPGQAEFEHGDTVPATPAQARAEGPTDTRACGQPHKPPAHRWCGPIETNVTNCVRTPHIAGGRADGALTPGERVQQTEACCRPRPLDTDHDTGIFRWVFDCC